MGQEFQPARVQHHHIMGRKTNMGSEPGKRPFRTVRKERISYGERGSFREQAEVFSHLSHSK